jgi:hypothetical protein
MPEGDSWVLAEAWWAASNRRLGFFTMLGWSWQHLWLILFRLWWATRQRFYRWLKPRPDSTDPSWLARSIDLLNCMGLLFLYPAGALIGYPVLALLLLLAKIPVPVWQDFVLVKLVRPFLEINAGEFRTYLEDELQAANMRRRVADVVSHLVDEEGCDDVTVVAHSEGAVVSFGMLTDPTLLAARHVRKLITLGAGLNKSWQVAPGLERLHGPLPDHIHWLDVWSSYDPVPAGWLEPPRLAPGDRVPIFRPSAAVVREQRLEPRMDPSPYAETSQDSVLYWPVSQQVTNEMNVMSDHGGYFDNDEQVLVRLAAEIDSAYHVDSRFWPEEAKPLPEEQRTRQLREVVQDRRERVSVLAAGRAICILAALIAVGQLWLELIARWLSGLSTAPAEITSAQPILAALAWVRAFLAPVQPLSLLLEPILALPFWLLGALVLSIPFWVLFSAWWSWGWEPWDRRARQTAIGTIARAGL